MSGAHGPAKGVCSSSSRDFAPGNGDLSPATCWSRIARAWFDLQPWHSAQGCGAGRWALPCSSPQNLRPTHAAHSPGNRLHTGLAALVKGLHHDDSVGPTHSCGTRTFVFRPPWQRRMSAALHSASLDRLRARHSAGLPIPTNLLAIGAICCVLTPCHGRACLLRRRR